MKMLLLRGLLVIDAGVLLLIGSLLVFAPTQVERAFHFADLPPAVKYLIGMWGCLMGTMAFGYLAAAANPLRHRIWINIGILRGAIECGLGIVYLVQGVVTIGQAGLGTAVAGLMALAYIILYPRKPRAVDTNPATPPAS